MNEGSSFHFNAPDNAAMKSPVSVMLEQGNPTIQFKIEGMPRCLIIDTGTNVSIL